MHDAPVIPVIVLAATSTHAVPLARALVAGGIRMLEVTLRTPVALHCIEAIAREVPEAVVGAGTVRSAADAQAAQRRRLPLRASAPATRARVGAGLPRARPAAAARRGDRQRDHGRRRTTATTS